MALTANREVNRYVDQELRSHAVAASVHVYKGGFVGLNTSGYARPLTAGDRLLGLAYEEKDNSSGANGDVSVRVFTFGDFEHTLSGAAVTDIGRPVFASDDTTLTFVADGNTYVGTVRDRPEANKIILRLDSDRRALKTVRYDAGNFGAGADLAQSGIHEFKEESWIVNTRIVNGATAAVGIDNSNTCVVTVRSGGSIIVSKTFDATTLFPASNSSVSLGTPASPRVDANDILTVQVTNGVTADPGPFAIEVDYV